MNDQSKYCPEVDLRPRLQWRVIHNDDAFNNFGGATTAQIIRDRIKLLSDVGVDVLTLPKYGGLGNNYVRDGADGISTFAFMIGGIGTWHFERHKDK